MNILELKNISSAYGRLKVLHGISLAVKPGEAICLLGSNGAGKSTTVKTILGLVKPVTGEIYYKGVNITGYKTERIVNLGIGVVPEGRGIFPKMTVEENLVIGARTSKKS
ncbi:MAG: ATP-binding cassette domain-containing protein, partial [Firmicutes bacterium]|nr:ATP-binding cassette domain-containing protein [Bacillota bacterium]